MGGKISVGRTPDRVLERLRHAEPLDLQVLEEPPAREGRPAPDAGRFDRALAEADCVPLVLGFRCTDPQHIAADLDRLRIELESTVLRVPVLRARPLERIEIRLPRAEPGIELAAFLREVRRPFRRSSSVPVIAFIAGSFAAGTAPEFRSAGCAHLWLEGSAFDDLRPRCEAFRSEGIVSIGLELTPEALLARSERGDLEPLDAVVVRSPLERREFDEGRLRGSIEAGLIGSAQLLDAGFRSPGPRRFVRGERAPSPGPYAGSGTRLEFGPGAVRTEGALTWWNDLDRERWAEAIDHGRVPPGRSHRSDTAESLRRAILRSFLGAGALEVVEIEQEFGIEFIHRFPREMGEIEERQHDGLVEVDFDRIEATALGRLLIEDVAGCFDPAPRARDRAGGSP